MADVLDGAPAPAAGAVEAPLKAPAGPPPPAEAREAAAGSLEAEEAAGGPPMPSAAAPAVSAVRDGPDGDVVMHEVDGPALPNGHVEHPPGPERPGDALGMPGDARELGNGPETDERAPPMSADVDQPTGASTRVDGDVAMTSAAAPIDPSALPSYAAPTLNTLLGPPGVPQDVEHGNLPPTLAPATEPGADASANLSSASDATAPPSESGEAAAVAAAPQTFSVGGEAQPGSAPAPAAPLPSAMEQDAAMGDAAVSPSTVAKRPASEDDAERDAKRGRFDGEHALPPAVTEPADGLSASEFKPDSAPVPLAAAEPLSAAAAPEADVKPEDGFAAPADPAAPIASPSVEPPAVPMPEPMAAAPADGPGGEAAAAAAAGADASMAAPDASTSYSPAPTGTIAPGDLSAPPSAATTQPPTPYAPPTLPAPRPDKLPREQQRFAESVVKQLRKHPASLPFLNPVDPVLLNIPTYFDHIKSPMDLTTVEKKLKAHAYKVIDEWIADVRLIWANCYTFNGPPGPNAPVSISAKAMEDLFDKQVTKIPQPKPPAPPKPKAMPGYSHRGNGGGGGGQARRPSGDQRVRRESKAPVHYEPEFDDAPKQRRSNAPQNAQMRYCGSILREFFKKGNEAFAYPFLAPVDPVALNLPDYFRVIKSPMDLGTIKKKFDAGQYASPEHFAADVRLVCRNCFTYNPVGTAVHEMGRKLEHLFESKWRQMPEPGDEPEEEFYAGDAGGHADAQIMEMERQLAAMRQNLAQMKKKNVGAASPTYERAPVYERPPPVERPPPPPPVVAAPKPPRPPPRARTSTEHSAHSRRTSSAAASIASPAVPAPVAPSRQASATKASGYASDEYVYDEPEPQTVATPTGVREVTFDMKRELATKITTFEGPQLEKAIDIIRSSAPQLLGDEHAEIELDIDLLDPATLLKLYDFVVRGSSGGGGGPRSPQRRKPEATLTAAGVRAQKSGRAGTGGLKGTHLDESIESAKIAQLEQKLKALESNNTAYSPPPLPVAAAGSPSAAAGAAGRKDAEEDYSSGEDAGGSSDSDY